MASFLSYRHLFVLNYVRCCYLFKSTCIMWKLLPATDFHWSHKVLCSQCWTQVHVSSCESGNTTTSHQHYATIYTGCLFVSEYCTSWATLFTSVFMGQLHLIWRIYVFQSLPIPVVVIFAQQHMETCRCLGRERWPMDHKILLFLVLLSGTLCHRPYVYRPLHSDSFRVD